MNRPSRAEDKATTRRKAALVIDDDEQFITVMKHALPSLGWQEVRSLTDPRRAVEVIADDHPDLVFLDLCMAERDGRQVLKDLQEQAGDLPVIVVTSLKATETAIGCMRDGAVDYITKPFNRSRLIAAMEHALSERNTRVPPGPGDDLRSMMRFLHDLPSLKQAPDILIEEALRRSDGVLKDAAAMLGITAQAICNRRRRVGSGGRQAI